MKLTELSTFIQVPLVVKWNTQSGGWQASLEHVELKQGACLRSEWGAGETPTDALADYTAKLRGQRLVMNATSTMDRREYTVPLSLEY